MFLRGLDIAFAEGLPNVIIEKPENSEVAAKIVVFVISGLVLESQHNYLSWKEQMLEKQEGV